MRLADQHHSALYFLGDERPVLVHPDLAIYDLRLAGGAYAPPHPPQANGSSRRS
jgi:hypothetical protein